VTVPARVSQAEVLRDFGAMVAALGEYRSVAVLTGGFVSWVYQHMPAFSAPPMPALLTTDVDWTVPARLPILGERTLAARLADSGFVVVRSTDTTPEVQRYQHRRFGDRDLAPVYGEFLAPLRGSATRKGEDLRVRRVQAGLTAQALRYLDLLLDDPVSFDAAALPGLGLAEPHLIRVPRPAAYVLQKLLSWEERSPAKRDKDAAYLHEVALTTRGGWTDIRRDVERIEASSHERGRWVARARQQMRVLFLASAADGAVRVVRQCGVVPDPAARPTEDGVRRVMTRFAAECGLGAG
jgi:hypothetical protein